MKFVPSRELRLRTAQVLKMLEEEGEIVVTANGKPASVMLSAKEDNLEQMMAMVRTIRAKNAARRMREVAIKRKLTEEDVNKEIAAVKSDK